MISNSVGLSAARSDASSFETAAAWGIYPRLIHAEITHFYRAAGTADIAMMAGAVDDTGARFQASSCAGFGELVPVLMEKRTGVGPRLVVGRLGQPQCFVAGHRPTLAARWQAVAPILDYDLDLGFRRCLLPVHGHAETVTFAGVEGDGNEARFIARHRDGGMVFVLGIADMDDNQRGPPRVVALTRRCKDRLRAPAGTMPLFVRGEAAIKAWLDPDGPHLGQTKLMTLRAWEVDRRMDEVGDPAASISRRLNA